MTRTTDDAVSSSGTLWPVDDERGLAMWQPWAAFVAYNIKKAETRSWSTKFRGRLRILATQRPPFSLSKNGGGDIVGDYVLDWGLHPDLGGFNNGGFDEGCGFVLSGPDRDEDYHPMHLGCFVATAELVACVPTESIEWVTDEYVANAENIGDELLGRGWLHWEFNDQPMYTVMHEAQRPYGDYSPGRFAWLLADIKRHDPIPAKGRQGLWKLPSADAAS